MSTGIRRALVLAVLLGCAAPAAAQSPELQPAGDTQDDINDLFGGGRRRRAQPPAAPPAERREPTPAERLAAAAAALDTQIASLEASLASMTAPAFPTVAAARERAAALRTRVDRMRKDLYISDPHSDRAVGLTLSALQSRWGDLAADIVQGRIPEAPLDAGRWKEYARGFSRLYCAPPAVPAAVPASGMPLVGNAWACLSDLFFHELAPIEVRVARALDAKRAIATGPLVRAMDAAEKLLADVERLNPVPRFALQRLAESLHSVNRLGTELRISELKAQRNAGDGTAAFHWLLDLSRVVRRPSTVPKLTITLDEVKAILPGTAPKAATAAQSDALHRIHYRYALLEAGVTGPDDARATLDVQRAQALAALAEAAGRP